MKNKKILTELDREYKELEKQSIELNELSDDILKTLRKFKVSTTKKEIFIYDIAFRFSSYNDILSLILKYSTEGKEGKEDGTNSKKHKK